MEQSELSDCKEVNNKNHNNEKDTIEWQSLQSYNTMDIEDLHTIEIKTESKYTEEADVGCTDQLLRAGHLQQMATHLMHGTEDFVRKVWRRGWGLVQHKHLPNWLKDNNFLVRSHRPELNSYANCFRSIFRLHTETVNIWTHLLGWIAFVAMAIGMMIQPRSTLPWQDKAVMLCFFVGAVLCMGFSWLFHTVYCHSQRVGKVFNKLDYCGIAFLTVGSFVPWLYYSFYCRMIPMLVYVCVIVFLGALTIAVSMTDRFLTPPFRPLRAGLFIGLGLSGVVPCVHFIILEGFYPAVKYGSVGWLSLMALLYITGAVIYAVRVPERCFPGRFDILFQSHQIFHVFVVAAAFVHMYGVFLICQFRLTHGDCHGPVHVSIPAATPVIRLYNE